MKKLILILFLLLSMISCDIYNDVEEPIIYVYNLIPTFINTIYDGRKIDQYSGESSLLVCIGDRSASRYNISGENLEFKISTSSGENETFKLDGKDIIGLDFADEITVTYFKRIYPKRIMYPTANNDTLEVNNNGDTIYVHYSRYAIPQITTIDTLPYPGKYSP